jgi:hypothetical protein
MRTAWDAAKRALFLAYKEAACIMGVRLPVEGGMICPTA